ncbi:histone-lysine N-methyltransferase SETMAR-like [Centruroides vittatus]|uniref:histone-lysine N-methyltransferase SETMAR-like n=1 Tax=Centruroides vittatus TaxID=120091 RepID=UPI0035102B3D
MEHLKVHVRHIMLWEFKLGNNATETTKKICNVYGSGVISDRAVRKWFTKFRSGDFSLKDEERPGRSSDFDDDVLKVLIEQNPRQMTRELAEKLHTSQSTINCHLQKLGKKVDSCYLAFLAKKESFLAKIVTGDEKWITYKNVIRKRQWVDKNYQPQPDPKPSVHGRKILLCVWWDCQGIIHFELLPRNETVTANVYIQQLEQLRLKLHEKHPALVNRKKITLLHDNARPHTAKITQEKILEFGWSVLPHPPYSLDLAPTDFHLFRALQNALQGQCFQNDDQVQEFIQEFFDSKPPEFCARGIDKLPEKWQEVINNDGEYVLD